MKYTRHTIALFSILFISAIIRIWYMLQPVIVWWDAAMYIGIGKYIFSGGTIGVFEYFRPPLLPLILGFVWKIGLDPLICGKIFMLIFSLGELYIVYLLGKKINAYVGLLSVILLSFSPVFITYANAPLTDIPSVFFATLALLLTLEKKYISTGISIAAAFYMRFPGGLIIVPIILYLIITEYKISWKSILSVVLGFIVPLIPYFIINFIYYHNLFTPIIGAQRVASDPVNATGRDIFFYTKNLLYENIFLIFSPLILIPFIKKDSRLWNPVLLIIISGVIVGSYFNFNTHLELRYSIAFLPFLCIAAAYGIYYLLEKIQAPYNHICYSAAYTITTLILISICIVGFKNNGSNYMMDTQYLEYITYFKNTPDTSIITTNPEAVAFEDLSIIQVTDTWENAASAYTTSGDAAHYIALDTCALACETENSCDVAKSSVNKYLSHLHTVSDTTYHGCDLHIYEH